MKRCLSIIAALFILVNISYGQLKLRAFGGVNISSLEDKIYLDISEADQLRLDSYYHRTIGPSIGIQLQLNLSKKINFNIESHFILKGQKYNDNTYVERSLYFELIPSIDVHLWDGFSFGLGPYVGVRPFTYFSDKNSVSGIEYIRSDWDYGGMTSFSYNVERLTFRVAYYYGLNNIYRTFFPVGDFKNWITIDKRNRVFQFGIGYTLSGYIPSGNRKK